MLKMAALNPARALGLDHRKGRIKSGFDADLNLLDQNLNVAATMVMGRKIR